MASLIRWRTQVSDSAAATQQGRSGTLAPKLVSPFSMTTKKRISSPLLAEKPGLLQDASEGPDRNIDARLPCYGDSSRVCRMANLVVAPARARKTPPPCSAPRRERFSQGRVPRRVALPA